MLCVVSLRTHMRLAVGKKKLNSKSIKLQPFQMRPFILMDRSFTFIVSQNTNIILILKCSPSLSPLPFSPLPPSLSLSLSFYPHTYTEELNSLSGMQLLQLNFLCNLTKKPNKQHQTKKERPVHAQSQPDAKLSYEMY